MGNNFFVHSTPWAWSIDPTQISTSGEYAKKYTTHETSELGKSDAIMLTKNLRVKMAQSKMEQQQKGGKLIDTPTFVSVTKHKAQLYSEMQKILEPKPRKKFKV